MDDPSELIFGDDDFLPDEDLELLDGEEFPDMFDEDSPQEDET
jgi:hypothetical protein